MSGVTVRCLSFHATYRCRHSGDCCTARWPIPIEPEALARARAALSVASGLPEPSHRAHAAGRLPLDTHGCVFHDAEARQCRIHAVLGHDALPLACRQFPRVTVHDPRGVSVALSAYCPTARAEILQGTDPITVVDAPAAFPPHAEYVGLDARASLPPALCPDVLMDWESWWEWEQLSVALFNTDAHPRDLLDQLRAAIEHARVWRPGSGELIDRVREAFAVLPASSSGNGSADDAALRRLLAAHAFGSWTAHLGAGLRTWLRSLETVVFLADLGWPVAEIDLWLRHWADPHVLARTWSAAERERART